MVKKHFTYPSRDGKTKVHGIMWLPDKPVKGILQIAHGMMEYIDRYDWFAGRMNEAGYLVVGNDHLGHGRTAGTMEDLGFFSGKKGNEYVIGDIHHLRQIMQRRYEGIPYMMLGHSMGSFLVRQYITLYGEDLAGAIIMGTGEEADIVLRGGRLLCAVVRLFKGDRYRSSMLAKMALGSLNKGFEDRTPADWISRDQKLVDRYVSDPLCTFSFTVNAYQQMFRGMQVMQDKDAVDAIPKTLPLFLVSGGDDPLGGRGKKIKHVLENYAKAGILDVRMKLYEGSRHEILNDLDREAVCQDIRRWMDEQTEKRL